MSLSEGAIRRSRTELWRGPREETLSSHECEALQCVDALCAVAGWTRSDLADRLGVGTQVLDYYARDTTPPWLAHALVGIAVVELGLPVEQATAICTAPSGYSTAR